MLMMLPDENCCGTHTNQSIPYDATAICREGVFISSICRVEKNRIKEEKKK